MHERALRITELKSTIFQNDAPKGYAHPKIRPQKNQILIPNGSRCLQNYATIWVFSEIYFFFHQKGYEGRMRIFSFND